MAVRSAPVSALKRASVRRFAAAFAAFALSLSVASVASADGSERVKRPTVCASGEPVKTAAGSFFLCTDSKRPRLLARWAVVTFEDESGKAQRYVVGWPQAAK